MTLHTRQSATVGRIAGEIVIVVIGILIAFALDAAWERRSARAEEHAHLRALASDFQENVSRLEQHIRQEESISAASREMLELAQRPGDTTGEAAGSLMGRVFNSGRYEPVMGAYEALVNSAGLTVIQDDSLRASLADFSARVSARYAERYSDELYFAFIREFSGQLGFAEASTAKGFDSQQLNGLLRNPKFRDYLALRYLSERDVARRYQELRTVAQAVLSRINSELGS
ncbi:MAG TPA: DUF6090 family protein [Gemmatimonadaceae bacterium]|nr:DUF6090 family protein [Gemmatimonadaceae bacterium]